MFVRTISLLYVDTSLIRPAIYNIFVWSWVYAYVIVKVISISMTHLLPLTIYVKTLH